MSVIYSPAKIPVKVSKSEPASAPRAKTEVRCTPPAAEAKAPAAAAETQAPAEAEAIEAVQAPATKPSATSKKGKSRK